ncbi:MAG: DUF1318 domain-containing protein [bacterium]
MKTRSASWLTGLVLAAAMAWPTAASARSKNEVLQSIKARYPTLVKLLADHKVGETDQGLIDAVKSDYLNEKVQSKGRTITIAQFIKNENADRQEYFQIAAKENNTSPQVVARNFARHRYSLLKSGEYWKKGNAWTTK